MKRSKPKRKAKKPRRVVLGIGVAWVADYHVNLLDRRAYEIPMPASGYRLLEGKRIRLIAEVLK